MYQQVYFEDIVILFPKQHVNMQIQLTKFYWNVILLAPKAANSVQRSI